MWAIQQAEDDRAAREERDWRQEREEENHRPAGQEDKLEQRWQTRILIRSLMIDDVSDDKSDDVLTLRPANAVKASKRGLLDHELFMVGKNTFLLHHASQAG